jgi:hypothetical protein
MSIYHPSSPSVAPDQAADAARRSTSMGRPLAALLLAAAVAALAVAAERLMASWADEHLLATWVALWAVVFAGSLVLAGTMRRVAQRVIRALDGWARQRAEARAQARAAVWARHQPTSTAHLQTSADVDTAWHGLGVIELGQHRRYIAFHI